MADKLSMSLDDIISQNKGKQRRGGRGGGQRNRGMARQRAGVRKFSQSPRFRQTQPYSRPRQIPDKWEHDMFEDQGKSAGGDAGGSSKIVISNLDFGVTDTDIKELFADFGTIKKSQIHYDFSGRSLGTADVIFERKSDAVNAQKQYNGIPLDGRAMDIKVASSGPSNLTRRIGGGPQRGGRQQSFNRRNQGGSGQRRGGRGGGGGGQNRSQRMTAEELDAQLDDYINKMT